MSGLANAYTPGRCVFIILIYNILMNKNVITFQGIKARGILLCMFFLDCYMELYILIFLSFDIPNNLAIGEAYLMLFFEKKKTVQ